MTDAPSGKSLDELTKLVHESLSVLELSEVSFAIRPLPFEFGTGASPRNPQRKRS
jgi:hypothetical protein